MRTLNVRFALGLALTVTLLTAGVFLLHRVQYRRITNELLWQIDHARQAGRPDVASAHAHRYLEFCPEDTRMLVQLADWIGERPIGRPQIVSQISLFERVLRVAPERSDIRRRVVALNL